MTRSGRLALALGLDLALVAGEGIAARFAHSTGLLADAGHNLADAGALLFALFAVRLARRAPTRMRSYGLHRATILSALLNVALLLVTMALITAVAVDRLEHPLAVRGGLVALAAGLAALVNGAAALAVADRSSDLNMRSAFWHLAGDALASFGVFIAGLIELSTHRLYVLDPVVSLVIAAVIAFEALRIGRASVEILLEAVPPDIDLADLAVAMGAVPGVLDVHDLHVWSLSSEVRALSAHLVIAGDPSLEQAQLTGDEVRQQLRSRFSITHATLELECAPCVEEKAIACAIEQISATPSEARR